MRTIGISGKEANAIVHTSTRRLKTVGRLVDRMVWPGGDDPLIVVFERTAAEAREVGLTEAEIEAELAAYNAERRG